MAGLPRIFRIFVSSSFADMADERRALRTGAFGPLAARCAARGATFQAIDLRWGVSRAAALDQQTMPICLAEVRRCLHASPRLNFLVLLGDRRGWLPLPTVIPGDEFETLAEGMTRGERQLLETWYRVDRNTVPIARRLVRRTGRHERPAQWDTVEREVHEMLARVADRLPVGRRGRYISSAVEQEVAAGILDVPDPSGAFAVLRRSLPAAGPPDGRGLDGRHMRRLEQELRGKLTPEQILTFAAPAADPGARRRYLDRLTDEVCKRFTTVVDNVLDAEPTAREAAGSDGHRRLARQLSAVASPDSAANPSDGRLVGRRRMLAEVTRYLRGSDPAVLAVVGPAGTGKSALLAAAVDTASGGTTAGGGRERVMTVLRLLGTTPGTSGVEKLLRGLTDEISNRLEVDGEAASGDLHELLGRFGELLALAGPERPIWLFLDAVDQLTPEHGAHDLAWLPDPLPPHVRVVLSALPDTCDGAVTRRGGRLLRLDGLSVASGRLLLNRWLAAAGRTLTSAQQDTILDRFRVEGRPLWLRLAFEEARAWHSDDGSPELPSDLPGLIRRLYLRLARPEARGPTLVRHALGFVAASGLGLSETELLEVLSQDPAVMNEVRIRSHPEWRPELHSIPVVVWAQLRADLQPYLTERSVEDELLIGFYHRALAEVAAADALAPPNGVARHRQLADLFRRRGDPAGEGSWRGAPPRALAQLPLQLRASGSWEELTRLLHDFRFLERKAAVVDRVELSDGRGRSRLRFGGVHALRADLATLLTEPGAALPVGTRSTLEAVARALRLESDLLTRRPELLWQQVANRLLWHRDESIRALVEQEASRRKAAAETSWLRLQAPGSEPEALQHVLRAHGRAVSCALSPDGTLLVTGGQEGEAALWQVGSGELLAELRGHDQQVCDCTFGPDSRTIYTADVAGTLRRWFWDGVRATLRTARDVAGDRILSCAATARHVVTAGTAGLQVCAPDTLAVIAAPEDEPVQCCATSTNGDVIVAGYADGSVRTWVRRTGGAVQAVARRDAAHDGAVYGCAVDSAGATVLTGGRDGRLRLWDAQLQPRAEPLVPPGLPVVPTVWACAADRSVERIAVALAGGLLQVWDVPGRSVGVLSGHAGHVAAVAVSADGNLVASAGLDGAVRLWNTDDPLAAAPEPFSTLLQSLSISRDGRRLVTVDGYGLVRVQTIPAPVGDVLVETCQAWCVDASISVDQDRLVVVDEAAALEVWDLAPEPRRRHRLTHHRVAACVLLRGGVVVSAADDGTVMTWDTERGDLLWSVRFRPGVPVLAVHRRDQLVLVGSGSGEVGLLHPDTRRENRLREGGDAVLSCTFGAAGVIAAGTATGRVLRWNRHGATMSTQEESGAHSDRVLHLAAGTRAFPVVSASADHRLAAWPVARGSRPRWLTGHEGPVRQVACSPEAGLIVSASDDKSLRLWSVTGRPVAMLPITGNGQLLALHTPSGLIACGDDGGFTHLVTLTGSST